MKKVSPTIVMVLISVFAWGSVFPIAKHVLFDMSSLSFVIWRFTIALICLTLYLIWIRHRWTRLSVWQYLVIILVGALGVGGFNLSLFSGLQLTSATNGALIMALSPIMTSLIVAIMSRKWLDKKQLFSLTVALSGVILVITDGSIHQLLNLRLNHGDMLVVLAMIAWSGYTICSQKISDWLPSIELTFYTMAAGGTLLFAFSYFQNDVHLWQEFSSLSMISIISVIYMAVVGTVIAYLFWNKGIKELGSAKTSLFFNLVPVFAALVSFLVGQPLTQIELIGMFVVLTGLVGPVIATKLFSKDKLLS